MYTDSTGDSEGNITFCKSVDGGSTWSAYSRVNDNAYRWQYTPALGIDAAGGLHAAWTDLRSNSRYQTYYSWSSDVGGTFSANVNISDPLTSNSFEQTHIVVDNSTSSVYFSATRDYSQVMVARRSLVQAPTATTGTATNIGSSTAMLNGTVNPNGAETSTGFEYGVTTAYGSTATGATLTGSAFQTISAVVSGLACNMTYHFRATATNSGGTGTGADGTFTTGSCAVTPPTATTGWATNVGQTSATLNGTVNPNGAAATTGFEYGTTSSYGLTATAQPLTGSTAQSISASVSGLTCGTLYHFKARGTNSGGTIAGSDATFTTTACPASLGATVVIPSWEVATNGTTGGDIPAGARDTVVTLSNPSAENVLGKVEVWTTTGNAIFGFMVPLRPGDVVPVSMRSVLNGLLNVNSSTQVSGRVDVCSSTSWYRFQNPDATDRMIAVSIYNVPAFSGSQRTRYWDALDDSPGDAVFTGSFRGSLTVDVVNYCTSNPPSSPSYYTMDAISTVRPGGANSNLLSATASLVDPTGTTPTTAQVVAFDPTLDWETANTFYSRFYSSSDSGGGPNTSFAFVGDGRKASFVGMPSVTTDPASSVGETTATLNGTVNPNGASTATAFEYGTTTAYGLTATAQTLSGYRAQVSSASVSLLQCGTLYHFRAKGTSSAGPGCCVACPGAGAVASRMTPKAGVSRGASGGGRDGFCSGPKRSEGERRGARVVGSA